MISYATKHALCGEISKMDAAEPPPPITKFHVFPDLGTAPHPHLRYPPKRQRGKYLTEIFLSNDGICLEIALSTMAGYIVTIVIFSSPYMGNMTKFGLCLIMKLEHMSRYLVMHHIVEDRLLLLIPRLRILLENVRRRGGCACLPHLDANLMADRVMMGL